MSELLIGLEEIARYLRIPVSSVKRKSKQLQRAGVFFTMWRGRPPRLMTCTFTDRLQAWIIAGSDTLEMDE